MNRRPRQRLAGTFFLIVGGGFTAWIWRTALTEQTFSAKGSLLFPAVFVLGVSMFLFPDFREERIARGEDISELSGWRLITPRWWAILATCLLAGAVNFYLLSSL